MRKIGIYGGSFNPIHNGHISIARQMLSMAGLDEMWLVVSPQNPLKTRGSLLADEVRLMLTQKAVAQYPQLVASDYEFSLPRPSYMYNTLESMRQRWPDSEFTLLIGADNWEVFNRWYRADDIIAHYPIAIYPRTGSPVNEAALPPTVHLYPTRLLDVSSTMVRERVANGQDIDGLVPESIAEDVAKYYASNKEA